MGPDTSCCIWFNQMEDHVAPDYSFRAFPQLSHVPKFDGSNHREWNYELDLCFQNLEIAGIVLGQELCPIEVKQSREFFFYSLSCRTMSHQSTCCLSFTNLFSLFFFIFSLWSSDLMHVGHPHTWKFKRKSAIIHCPLNPFSFLIAHAIQRDS